MIVKDKSESVVNRVLGVEAINLTNFNRRSLLKHLDELRDDKKNNVGDL